MDLAAVLRYVIILRYSAAYSIIPIGFLYLVLVDSRKKGGIAMRPFLNEQ